jgi:hypothetical protein
MKINSMIYLNLCTINITVFLYIYLIKNIKFDLLENENDMDGGSSFIHRSRHGTCCGVTPAALQSTPIESRVPHDGAALRQGAQRRAALHGGRCAAALVRSPTRSLSRGITTTVPDEAAAVPAGPDSGGGQGRTFYEDPRVAYTVDRVIKGWDEGARAPPELAAALGEERVLMVSDSQPTSP